MRSLEIFLSKLRNIDWDAVMEHVLGGIQIILFIIFVSAILFYYVYKYINNI